MADFYCDRKREAERRVDVKCLSDTLGLSHGASTDPQKPLGHGQSVITQVAQIVTMERTAANGDAKLCKLFVGSLVRRWDCVNTGLIKINTHNVTKVTRHSSHSSIQISAKASFNRYLPQSTCHQERS